MYRDFIMNTFAYFKPYMIAAICEMAEKKEECREAYLKTAEYLKACNLLFENGILSHEKITSISSKPLTNMAEGMKWFMKWKEELQHEPGILFIYYSIIT